MILSKKLGLEKLVKKTVRKNLTLKQDAVSRKKAYYLIMKKFVSRTFYIFLSPILVKNLNKRFYSILETYAHIYTFFVAQCVFFKLGIPRSMSKSFQIIHLHMH